MKMNIQKYETLDLLITVLSTSTPNNQNKLLLLRKFANFLNDKINYLINQNNIYQNELHNNQQSNPKQNKPQ